MYGNNYRYKLFEAQNRDINRGWGKFCSTKNKNIMKASKRLPNCECATCKKTFYRLPSKLKSKSGLYFCCRACKDESQHMGGVAEVIPTHYGISHRAYRCLALRYLPHICNRCGYDKNELALIVHHIDRNRHNNDLSNLEIVSANCHLIGHFSS